MSEVTVKDAKIYLKNVKVIFVSLQDEGFGRSVTIDATDKDVQKGISDWVKANKIGKDHPGEANFKTYEEVIQYGFRLNDKTKFVYTSGTKEGDLGYGSTISLAANSFEYNNKFGKGVSASVSAIVVEKAATTGADDDLAELLGDDIIESGEPVDINLAEIPFQ